MTILNFSLHPALRMAKELSNRGKAWVSASLLATGETGYHGGANPVDIGKIANLFYSCNECERCLGVANVPGHQK